MKRQLTKFFSSAILVLSSMASPQAIAAKKAIVQADIVQGIESTENYIKYGHFEDKGALNVSAFADAAATTPVDLTGGSPGVTCTRSTSNVIMGTGSLAITHPGTSSRQGQGCAIPFTLEKDAQAKVLKVEFDYMVSSGTFTAGDPSTDSSIEVYLYDVTNSTLIQPSTYKLYSNSTGTAERFSGYFQSSSSGTSYRLGFYLPRTETTGFVLNVDSIRVSKSQYVYGTPITDWQSYTPTGSWNTNVTYSGIKRRVGDTAEYRVKLAMSGAPNAANLTITQPAGETIDSTKFGPHADVQNDTLGLWNYHDNGSTIYSSGLTVEYLSPTSVSLKINPNGNLNTTGSFSDGAVNTLVTVANTDEIFIHYSVPILGRSSTTQMSDDAEVRIVSGRFETTDSSTSLTNDTNVLVASGWSKVSDTHGKFNTSTGQYTAPVSGTYRISGAFRTTNVTAAAGVSGGRIVVAKNGTENCTLGGMFQGTTGMVFPIVMSGSTIIELVAGDTVDVRVRTATTSSAPTLSGTASQNYWTIDRIAGPATISSTELISAGAYRSSSAQTITAGSDVEVVLNSSRFDSHGAYSTSTGRFTAPVSGRYLVTYALKIQMGATAASSISALLKKNGTGDTLGLSVLNDLANSKQYTLAATAIVQLNAGDYVSVFVNAATQNVTVEFAGGSNDQSSAYFSRLGL